MVEYGAMLRLRLAQARRAYSTLVCPEERYKGFML